MCEKILNWLNCGTCALFGVLAGFVLGIPVVTAVQSLELEPEWVQAVGSIAAILVAIGVARHQGKQSLKLFEDENARRAEAEAQEREMHRAAVKSLIQPGLDALRGLTIKSIDASSAQRARNTFEGALSSLRTAADGAAKDLRTASIVARILQLASDGAALGLRDPLIGMSNPKGKEAAESAIVKKDKYLKDIDALLNEI